MNLVPGTRYHQDLHPLCQNAGDIHPPGCKKPAAGDVFCARFHLDALCFDVSVDQIEIEGNALKHIKVKVRPIENWTLVWDTRGTEAKNDVSIWAPVLSGSFFKRNKKAICTGHYAIAGVGSGSTKPPKAIKGAMLIELTDKQTNTLARSDVLDEQHVNFLMPHPVRRPCRI